MNGSLSKGGTAIVVFAFLLTSSARAQNGQAASTKQEPDSAAQKRNAEETATKSKAEKAHLESGNNAMHDAQGIRQQLQTATGADRSALLAKMNADYQTAVTEYKEALKNTIAEDGDSIQSFGLIRLLRNGQITEEKAIEMVTQDKNVPTIVSNLGIAYGASGDFEDAIPALQEALLSKQDAATYMALGTDFAELGKLQDAQAACDKVSAATPTATNIQASCYKNIGIVLSNRGKLGDATPPLQKATQLNPNDALAWKLLGDSLSNGITTRQENGKLVYIIPPGTIEAYQKCLQLEPTGPFASQVKAVLDGFSQLPKASTSAGTSNTP